MHRHTRSRAWSRSILLTAMAAAMLTESAQAASAVDLGLDALDPIVSPTLEGLRTSAGNALDMVNGLTGGPAEAPAAEEPAAEAPAAEEPAE